MAETTPPVPTDMHIQDITDSNIVVGNHNVVVGSNHGVIIHQLAPEDRPIAQPRTVPALVCPPDFVDLLDRATEVTTAISTIPTGRTVEIYGRPGSGKTVLLRRIANRSQSGQDAIGYLDARDQQRRDLAQCLFEAFYECRERYAPGEVELRNALKDKQAVILLDDVALPREDIEYLKLTAPHCTLVLATSERHLFSEVRAIPLPGLPLEDALALVEQILERPLLPEERPGAEALCRALEGHPESIARSVAEALEKRRSLSALASEWQATGSIDARAAETIESRPQSQRTILAALALFGSVPARAEHLSAIAGLPDARAELEQLLKAHLVQAQGERYQLREPFLGELERSGEWKPLLDRALEHFTSWSTQNQAASEHMLADAGAVLRLLQRAVDAGRWKDAQQLARRIEGAFILGARWDAWAQVLQSALTAAQAQEDQAGEAWALHQLGTRNGCLKDLTAARDQLTRAYHMRLAIHDQAGADLTRHNFQVLLGVPPLPPKSRQSLRPRRMRTVLYVVLLGVLFSAAATLPWDKFFPRNEGQKPPGNGGNNRAPRPEVIPKSRNFGSVFTNSNGKMDTVRIENRGNADLRLRTAEIVGANAEDYNIVSGKPSDTIVAPRGRHEISIRFLPQSVGTRSALLRILDDAGKPLPDVILTGVGSETLKSARIIRFYAEPQEIHEGESSMLIYRVQDIQHGSIEPGVGEIIPQENGQRSVSPPVGEATYTLTVFGPDGNPIHLSTTVTVVRRSLPPSGGALAADIRKFNPIVERGRITQLEYEVHNARSVSIAPEVEPVNATDTGVFKGVVKVRPRLGAIYILTAIGFDGFPVTRKAEAPVNNAPPRQPGANRRTRGNP